MKTCPSCGELFSDDLRFCLHDGTALPGSDGHADETALLPPDISNDLTVAENSQPEAGPTKKNSIRQINFSAIEPASRMGCVMSIGQITACVLLLSIGTFVAIRLFDTGQSPPGGAGINANKAVRTPDQYANSAANTVAPTRTPTPTPTPANRAANRTANQR